MAVYETSEPVSMAVSVTSESVSKSFLIGITTGGALFLLLINVCWVAVVCICYKRHSSHKAMKLESNP